jgi:hypothetical protein
LAARELVFNISQEGFSPRLSKARELAVGLIGRQPG